MVVGLEPEVEAMFFWMTHIANGGRKKLDRKSASQQR